MKTTFKNIAFASISMLMILIFVSCNYGTSKWEEVEVAKNENEMNYAKGDRVPFDLKAILDGDNGYGGTCNTYVFSGEIINSQEFLSEWTDDTGEKWGPFSRSILEVKVNKEYNGHSPVEEDTIKVLYPYSLSTVYDDGIQIKNNNEYVFVNCWVIDDKYMDFISEYKTESLNDQAIQNADVVIGAAWNSIFPIVDEKITFYREYLDGDNNGQVAAYSTQDTPMDDHAILDQDDFITMDLDHFDVMFSELFEDENTNELLSDDHIVE